MSFLSCFSCFMPDDPPHQQQQQQQQQDQQRQDVSQGNTKTLKHHLNPRSSDSPPPSYYTWFWSLAFLSVVIAICLYFFLRPNSQFNAEQPQAPFSEHIVQPPAAIPPVDEIPLTDMQPKRQVGYFVNWGIYDRKYKPQDVPYQHLTHINYAFANIDQATGEVKLSDAWADVDIHFDGDKHDEPGTNMYGCFKQIYLMKKANRNLKVLLSIGGWSFSPNFANIGNPSWRAAFVQSGVRLVEDLGLDGLDIDYEFPKTDEDAVAYVCLLNELRGGLEGLAQQKGRRPGQYQLTVAAPCGSHQVRVLHIAEMDRVIDFWNLMAYDFAGSWDSTAGHQANLYSDNPHGQSVDRAVRTYLDAGVHPYKITLGLPVYGRAFVDTDGPGAPYNGVGKGSWEDGMWDFKALPLAGAQEFVDHRLGASWSYDPQTRTMITYDTQPIVTQKAHYIHQMGLGGAMYWELDADAPEHTGRNLVRTVREQFGQLEYRENELGYPNSKYDNLRAGMQ